MHSSFCGAVAGGFDCPAPRPLGLPTSGASGRHGEEAVFIELSRRAAATRYDAGDGDFASGHPSIGAGRLTRVEWVNADGESRLPYDLKVYLTGKILTPHTLISLFHILRLRLLNH